jgi:hypothetical protein
MTSGTAATRAAKYHAINVISMTQGELLIHHATRKRHANVRI